MMAAAVAPVWAQDAVPSAAVADVVTKMTAPVAKMTAEQRAQYLSAAAYIPSTVDTWLCVSNIGRLLKVTVSDTAGQSQDMMTNLMRGLDSLAVGVSPEAAEQLKVLVAAMTRQSAAEMVVDMAASWSLAAKEGFAPIIKAQAEVANVDVNSLVASLQIKPVYAVLTVKPEQAGPLALMVGLGAAGLMQEAQSSVVVRNGFTGADFSKALDVPSPLYVMYKLEGSSLQVVLCADPAQVAMAASPAESVLSAKNLNDANINANTMLTACIGDGMAQLNNIQSDGMLQAVADFVAGSFRKMAEASPAMGRPGVAAADAVQALHNQIKKWMSTTDGTGQCYITWDKNVRVEVSGKVTPGVGYGPAWLTQPALLDDANVAFYAESSPVTGNPVKPADLLAPTESLCSGLIASFKPEVAQEWQVAYDMWMTLAPERESLCQSIQTLGNSLTGSDAMVVLAPTEGQPTAAAYFSAVKDRAGLSVAWQQMQKSVDAAAAKLGSEKPVSSQMPIASTTEGSLGIHTVTCCEDPSGTMSASVVVSDKALAMGNSVTLNKRLVAAPAPSIPLMGSVAQLRLEPLARVVEAAAAMTQDADTKKCADDILKASQYVERVFLNSFVVDGNSILRIDFIVR